MTATLFFADSVVHRRRPPMLRPRARTINQHVLAFIKAFKLSEAETLAKMGLRLCDDVGDSKVFCASQFNESLGDIAFLQTKYSSALEYQEQALRLREAELDSGHLLVSRSLQRIRIVYLALKRMSEAETFTKRAVSGLRNWCRSIESSGYPSVI
jgi:tetratricopeptide (TPR) repeat protein